MAAEITENKCIICEVSPLEILADPSGVFGTCSTCGAFYSRSYHGKVLESWYSPIRPSVVLLLKEYWHARKTRLPRMYPTQPVPQVVGEKEITTYNEWMSQHSEEIIRLGEDAINEHRETLRRLA